MEFDIVRPIFSGFVGGMLALFFCMLLRRWVPEVCYGKDAPTLVHENRTGVWLANALFFFGIAAGIASYQLGLLPDSDWRGLALGVGGGSIVALSVLFLFALARGVNPKEAYVAYAVAQSTPIFLLCGILTLSVTAFAAAAASLLGSAQAFSSKMKVHGVVLEIEKTITLPQGAHKLDNYDRYYADGAGESEGRIVAVFRYNPAGKGKIFFVAYASLPIVFDGGCNFIRVKYSMLQNRVESIDCNGEG